MGEVKSGKSSLLNALFGQEFAKVDVLPPLIVFTFSAMMRGKSQSKFRRK